MSNECKLPDGVTQERVEQLARTLSEENQKLHAAGFTAGQLWATQDADGKDLELLLGHDFDESPIESQQEFEDVINPNGAYFAPMALTFDGMPDDSEWLDGFVDGALDAAKAIMPHVYAAHPGLLHGEAA